MKKLLLITLSLAGITSSSNAGIAEAAIKYNLAGNFARGVVGVVPVLPGVLMLKMGEKFNSDVLHALGYITSRAAVTLETFNNINFILYEKYPNQDQDLQNTKSFVKRTGKRIIPYIPFILGKCAIAIPVIMILDKKKQS